MKRLLLLSLAFLFLVVGVKAQSRDTTRVRAARTASTDNPQITQQDIQQSVNMVAAPDAVLRNVRIFDMRYEGLRGTPYLLPEWNKGQIDLVSGQQYKNVPIKFDASRQQVIVLRPQFGNDSIALHTEQVKSFQFADNTGQLYLFRRFPNVKSDDALARDGYFLVLYEGKSSLLKRVVKSFNKADYKNPYSKDIRYDEFKPNFSYYLLKPDQTLEKVKLSEKSLVDALGDHKEELKAFVKQTNLPVKTEKDAVQLVQKYDSF